jgi:hypothetical protein
MELKEISVIRSYRKRIQGEHVGATYECRDEREKMKGPNTP